MMDDKVVVEITSDDKRVQMIKAALNMALDMALKEAKLEGPMAHMLTALAVTAFVWECGQRDDNIPPVAIQALLNMAVDSGLGERIGMHQMPGPADTLQ